MSSEVENSGLQVRINNESVYENVDMNGAFVPAYLSGEIIGLEKVTRAVELGISVNCTIQVITKTFAWNKKASYFAAIIPESSLEQGKNDIEIYIVRKMGGSVELRRLPGIMPRMLHLVKNMQGQEFLISGGGERLAVGAPRVDVRWALDRVLVNSDTITFIGWVSDMNTMSPPESILVFLGGEMVYEGAPNVHRRDLVRVYGHRSLLGSGYALTVRRNVRPGEMMSLRWFAQFADGVIELPLSNERRRAISEEVGGAD